MSLVIQVQCIVQTVYRVHYIQCIANIFEENSFPFYVMKNLLINMKKVIQLFPNNMTENIILKKTSKDDDCRLIKINQNGQRCLRLRSWIFYN